MSTPDWRVGRSSAEQQLYLLDSGLHSDCTFRVGTPGENPQHGQDVPAKGQTGQTVGKDMKPTEGKKDIKDFNLHRLLLAKASPVWENMLLPAAGSTQLSEAATDLVEILDIPPSIFTHVLRHVYGDIRALSTLSYPEVEAVFLVADKYQISALISACETQLCEGELLSPSTVWSALRLVDSLNGLDKLRNACAQVLRERTTECLASPGFLESSESSVELLCSQDSLSLTSEFPLVCAVVGWARGQATRCLASSTLAIQGAGVTFSQGESTHAVLAPRLLPMLRLAACSKQELENIILMADWLTQEETQALKVGDLTRFPSTLNRVKNARKNLTIPQGQSISRSRAVLLEKGTTFKHLGDKSFCVLHTTNNMWLHSIGIPCQINHLQNIQNIGKSSKPAYNYAEHLEFTLYHMERTCDFFLRESKHLDKISTSYKGTAHFSNGIYSYQTTVPLPTPVLLTSSTKLVIEVTFLKEGFYSIHHLSDTICCTKVNVYFYSENCNGSISNHNFVRSIDYSCP